MDGVGMMASVAGRCEFTHGRLYEATTWIWVG
jgi:hypothetical protein